MVNTLGSSFNETCSTPEVRENNSSQENSPRDYRALHR